MTQKIRELALQIGWNPATREPLETFVLRMMRAGATLGSVEADLAILQRKLAEKENITVRWH